jgi:hypothetical protein
VPNWDSLGVKGDKRAKKWLIQSQTFRVVVWSGQDISIMSSRVPIVSCFMAFVFDLLLYLICFYTWFALIYAC